MKAHGGSGCIDPHFLDLGTSWRWMVSFNPRPLYPRERTPGTHCIGGWVDPRVGLDNMVKWKFFTLPGLEPRPLSRPASSQSLYRLRYPGSPSRAYLCKYPSRRRKFWSEVVNKHETQILGSNLKVTNKQTNKQALSWHRATSRLGNNCSSAQR
jgi:hypothetical protein